MLSSALSSKFDSLNDNDEEYQDSVFNWSAGLWPTSTDDDNKDDEFAVHLAFYLIIIVPNMHYFTFVHIEEH